MFTSKQAWNAVSNVLSSLDGEYAEPLHGLQDRLVHYADRSDALYGACAQLIHTLEGVQHRLDEDYHVNELGEVQGAGSWVDVLCAERERAAREVRRMAYTLVTYGVVPEDLVMKMLADTPFEHGNITASGR